MNLPTARSLIAGGILLVSLCSWADTATHKSSLLVPLESGEALATPPRRRAHVAAPTKATAAARHLQAVDLALKGDSKGALEVLNQLTSASTAPAMDDAERDRVWLTMARVKYQSEDFQGALAAYQNVRRGGPSWLEALEERADTQMRVGQPQAALATLKTVLTPLFRDRIRSEPYFLAAYAQLRVCDYKSVFKTIDLFKTRFRDPIKLWSAAAGDGHADQIARERLNEARETIQKLNLVEAEAIQRLYLDENGKRQSGSPPKIGRDADQLTFPMDPEMESKEVWMDEVDDYRVTVKGCVQPQLEKPLDVTDSGKKARAL